MQGNALAKPMSGIQQDGFEPDDIIRFASPIGKTVPSSSDHEKKIGSERQVTQPKNTAPSKFSSRTKQSMTSAVRSSSPKSPDVFGQQIQPSKVSKHKKSGNSATSKSSGATGQRSLFGVDAVSEEDLFALLLFRWKQDRIKDEARAKKDEKKLDAALAAFEEAQDEIDRLRAANNDQSSQLASYKFKHETCKKKLEETLKSFQDFSRGLTNDHNNLLESARGLKKEVEAVKAERDELAEMAAGSRKILEDARGFQANELKAAARDFNAHITSLEKTIGNKDAQIAKLEHTIREQDIQSEDHDKLIEHERSRNDNFEHTISEVSAAQSKVARILETNQTSLMEKLECALARIPDRGDASIGSSSNLSTSVLDDVVANLNELMSRPALGSLDLKGLEQAARNEFARYVSAELEHQFYL